MIKRLIGMLMGQQPEKSSRPLRIPFEEHDIDIRKISPCATRIISTLNQSGHEAYVVGGAVRQSHNQQNQ